MVDNQSGAGKGSETADGSGNPSISLSQHSSEATTVTLPFAAGESIREAQERLGHRHGTTTRLYDKRRHTSAERASHDLHF